METSFETKTTDLRYGNYTRRMFRILFSIKRPQIYNIKLPPVQQTIDT